MRYLIYLALFGDGIYILWIFYNAVDEGFRGITSIQGISAIGLIILLVLNIVLLRRIK